MDLQCLSYPVDSSMLLRKKIRFKQELLNRSVDFLEKKIAVLGGSTTDEIVDQLELFLLGYGIKPMFYQSEYARYWEDAVFGNDELDTFHPDLIYIHTNWRNISSFPTINNSSEDVDALLNAEYQRFELMWKKIHDRYTCPIIQDNFDRPGWRTLGNRDVSDYRGKTNYISRLNQLLYSYAQQQEGFYINDVDYLAACYGLDAWSNPVFWYNYKYSLCLDAIPMLAKNVADIIKSIYGKNKKVLVLDLDNTLWGGVVGDDGVEGLRVGLETPIGQAYREFQAYIKELKTTGVLLAVNSKNDADNAIAGLNHPECILRPDDFVCIRANWDSKAENIRSITAELNLGADSFVFVDDNPVERESVRQLGLGVSLPNIDRVENYVRVIDHNGYFDVTTLTKDDIQRAEMYHANRQRAQLLDSIGSYDDFLASLEMRATIRDFETVYVERIAQLTNKSNQFNLTTLRCTESDIIRMKDSPDYLCLYGRLEDKFGDNGVVSIVAGEKIGTDLHMRLWLMSCRVLKRGLEDAMLDALMADAGKRGLKRVIGYYYPTMKNKMVKDFYGQMGFVQEELAADGSSVWSCAVDSYQNRNVNIIIER